MEDKFIKYTKLYIFILLLLLSVPVLFGLLIAVFYGFSTLISSKPVDIVFELLVIAIGPAIIAAAYGIFFIRTRKQSASIVKIISISFFLAGFISCIVVMVMDIFSLFNHNNHVISDYYSYSLPFLAGNIGTLFLIAVLQALSASKEKDWMHRNNEK